MPRLARIDIGGQVYHVINRANGRMQIFSDKEDYLLFEKLLHDAKELVGMRILAYTLMPNHWHLVLHPRNDKDMGIFMHRLTNTHTRHVHVRTGTIGSGYLYQGRYKSFIVDSDAYFLTLIKYVERNPVRAKLVQKCEDWQWGSAWRRIKGTKAQRTLLAAPPLPLPHRYRQWVNTPDREDELEKIRYSVNKGAPYGRESWVEKMVTKYNMETTLRSVGRPKNN
ncbi:MAG: transposase [Parcubacteria group bacterium]|nr:transposase [Parcubacteria group bacterium]